jgi:hypothetical protein
MFGKALHALLAGVSVRGLLFQNMGLLEAAAGHVTADLATVELGLLDDCTGQALFSGRLDEPEEAVRRLGRLPQLGVHRLRDPYALGRAATTAFAAVRGCGSVVHAVS